MYTNTLSTSIPYNSRFGKRFFNPAECSNLPGHHEDPNLEVSCEDQLFCPPRVPLGKPDGE